VSGPVARSFREPADRLGESAHAGKGIRRGQGRSLKPTGGGLNLVTTWQVDALGRPTQETDPDGNVTYTVYNDTNYEVLTYPGWNSSTNTPTGPTEVVRQDRANSYTETLTMTATPHLTGGAPDGTEAIGNVVTLSRTYTNSAGQDVRSDDYVNLSGVTYATTDYLGTANTNYYSTLYAYDADGRPDGTQSPTGTIDRKVYDSLGRVTSTWMGTNDMPTSGNWSPGNNTGSANLVEVSANVYDGGGVGDGDLTQITVYPGGSSAARVTQNYYDWRDRLMASKDGVQSTEDTTTHRPITYYTYDNLDEVTQVQQYDGDGVTITSSGGVPQAPSASLLRAQGVTSYDDQGRAYQLLEEIESGQGETLTRAARRLPRTRQDRPVTPSCLFRWVTTGAIGPNGQRVKLEAARIAGKWVTTPGAIRRFVQAQTPHGSAQAPTFPRSASQRHRANERAREQLEKRGM
jgi:hypothetical protein